METRLTHGLTYEAGLGQPRFAFRLTFVQEFIPGRRPGVETAIRFYDIDIPPVRQNPGGPPSHTAIAAVEEDGRIPGRQVPEVRVGNGLWSQVHRTVVGNFRVV